MYTRTARLVYSTSPHENTVMIDYDQTLKLFLTGEEKVPFSAEKILRILARLYRLRRDWQEEYPHLSDLFALAEVGVS